VDKDSELQLKADYNMAHPPFDTRDVPVSFDDVDTADENTEAGHNYPGTGYNAYNPNTYSGNTTTFPGSSSEPVDSGVHDSKHHSSYHPVEAQEGKPEFHQESPREEEAKEETKRGIKRHHESHSYEVPQKYDEHTRDPKLHHGYPRTQETPEGPPHKTSSWSPQYPNSLAGSYQGGKQIHTQNNNQDSYYHEDLDEAGRQQLAYQEDIKGPEVGSPKMLEKYEIGEGKLNRTNELELKSLRIIMDEPAKSVDNPEDDLYDASEPEHERRKAPKNDSEATLDFSNNDLFVQSTKESDGTRFLQYNLTETALAGTPKTQVFGDPIETSEQQVTYQPTSLPGISSESGENPAVERPVMSRSSSLCSLQSIFSRQSVSSKSSSISAYPPYRDNGDRLLEFLSSDSQLQALFNEVTPKVDLDRFEKNFRRCLQRFSEHLHIEGKRSPLLRDASTVVRHFAKNTAHSIRRVLEEDGFKESRKPTLHLPQEIETSGDEDDEGDEDDSIDADEELEEESIPNLEQALRDSNAFQMLRDNLRLFLNPNQAERAVFEAWSPEQPRSLPDELIHNIEWELVHFLDINYEQQQELGRIFTLSGQDDKAQATTCKEYLAENWPEAGPLLLEAIEEFLIIRNNGELNSFFERLYYSVNK
jgi:hypothetical protein